MAITRLFGFRRRKSSDIPPEVAAEHARDENNRSFYSNIEENMNFEALVLNMMKEKGRGNGGYGAGASLLDVRPGTRSSGGDSSYRGGGSNSGQSFGAHSLKGRGVSSSAYIAIPSGTSGR
ncbi:hypothetical protein TWF281_003790 [Arthrobotrys megalospora]